MRASRILSTWRLALGVFVYAFTAPRAHAETEAIRVDYRAPSGCPTSERFVADVLARTARARVASTEEAARTFVVVITQDTSSAFAGSLAIREPSTTASAGTETVARKVRSARCAEVAEALALSTALAVDPIPTPTPEPEPLPSPPSKPEPNERAAREPGPPTRKEEPARPNTHDERPVEARDAPSRESRPDAGTWSYWFGLGPALRGGMSPNVALGGSVSFAAMISSASGGSEVATLGADLALLRGPIATVDGASSSFGFLLVRPRACFVAAHISSALAVGPCVGGELGALRASGSELPHPETQQRFWAAATLALRVDARLSGRWLAEFDAGVALAMTRYRFVFLEPDTTIYAVPAIGLTLAVRFGARAF